MGYFKVYLRGFIHAFINIEDIYQHLWINIVKDMYYEIWEGYIPENIQYAKQGDVDQMFFGMEESFKEVFRHSEIAATKIVLTKKIADNNEIQEKITKIRSSR